MLIDFRERGREGEKEGEKHRCEREALTDCLSFCPDWDRTHSLGMRLNQIANLWPFGLWDYIPIN